MTVEFFSFGSAPADFCWARPSPHTSYSRCVDKARLVGRRIYPHKLRMSAPLRAFDLSDYLIFLLPDVLLLVSEVQPFFNPSWESGRSAVITSPTHNARAACISAHAHTIGTKIT